MNIKQMALYFLCRTIYRPVSLKPISVDKTINNNNFELEYIRDSTFNLIKIHSGNVYYFRECKKHYKFDLYIKNIISDYTNYIAKNELSCSEKRTLLEIWNDKRTVRLLYNIGVVNDINSNIYKFFKTNDYSLLGLEKHQESISIQNARNFAQYIWGEVYNYRLNCGVRINRFQTFCAVRQIATKKIADILGIGYLIPNTELCTIKIGERLHYGTIMETVSGVNPNSLSTKQRSLLSPIIQHDCSNLSILDAICHERDHRPGNYNVSLDKNGFIEHLYAFDNDSPMSFFLTKRIDLRTYWGSSPLIDSNTNCLNLPYLDKKLAKRILHLSYKEFYDSLKDVLTEIQIYYTWKRILALKDSIRTTHKKRHDFLLEDSEWNDNTVKTELSLSSYYGYLRILKESDMREKLMGQEI